MPHCGLGWQEILFALPPVHPAQMPVWQHEASFPSFSPEVVHTFPVLY